MLTVDQPICQDVVYDVSLVLDDWGSIDLRFTDGGLLRFNFCDDKHLSSNTHKQQAPHKVQGWCEQIRSFLNGQQSVLSIPCILEGSSFQKKVWQALRDIPYGQLKSYGQIAKAIGVPRAARAVGAACGKNPIPVVIPCHRVVGANGSLTGFSAGMHRKVALLKLEGHDMTSYR